MAEKFYHFEQGDTPEIVGEKGGLKSSKKERCVWIFLTLVLVAAVIGVSVYFSQNYVKKGSGDKSDKEAQGGSTIKPTITTSAPTTTPKLSEESLQKRIDCIPEAQGGVVVATEELCDKRGCVFHDSKTDDVPKCFFSDDTGYHVAGVEETPLGYQVRLLQNGEGPFGGDIAEAVLDVEMRGDSLIRFKFDDPVFSRYKVPVNLNLPGEKAKNPLYEFRITNNNTFAFQIVRKSTGTVLWDTGVGGLVLSDQFLQLSTKLPSNNVYGFGENLHKSFRHDMNYKSWPMFSRDQPPTWKAYSNLYGVHPFYTCLETDGNAHGVFLLNSNAQDYSFTPLPMLTYRTIGGILDFYMVLGPEPETVVQQYTGMVGRPYMPPYWSLGFQLCRYGYNSLENLKAAVDRTRQYNIPHDVQYADIDHMDQQKDFTIDQDRFGGLAEYFRELREGGMKTIIILDPTLISNETNYEPYDNLTAIDGAIKWPAEYSAPDTDKDGNGAVLGYVWPVGKVVFPDFFKNSTQELWKRLIVKHHGRLPFDGLWIDMNEPANFGTNQERPWNWPEEVKPYWSLHCPLNNRYEDPPYRTKVAYVHDGENEEIRISDKTICMVARQGNNQEYRHYDVHSLYGWSQTHPTLLAAREATGERSLVLTRSTFAGSGQYSGHWLGDNDSLWPDLADSIIGMLEFNLFGIPYIGADIGGFWGNSTAEMCKRWMQLGAFYPFSRNHNGIDNREQDPGFFGEDVARASREALETRYWLLPYLYTLFHLAHTRGHTVVRALHHEFPTDQEALAIDRQFLWGSSLMIAPVLEEGQTSLSYYLPAGLWYDFYTGSLLEGPGLQEQSVNPDSKIALFVRGGFILPMQKPALNTTYSRRNNLKLLVALDKEGMASGDLFWDDGTSVDTFEKGNYYYASFKMEKDTLSMRVNHGQDPETPFLSFDSVQIYGAPQGVKAVLYEGMELPFAYSQDVKTTLTITDVNIPLIKDFYINLSPNGKQNERAHIDCYPEAKGGVDMVTKESCEGRGCVYNPGVQEGPWCYYDTSSSSNYGYKQVGDVKQTEFGYEYILQHRGKRNPFASQSPDVSTLRLTVEDRDDYVMRIKIEDANKKRYEVPVTMNLGRNKARHPFYHFQITNKDPFSFQVIRFSNGEILFDTGVGGLIYSDQFLQLSTALPTNKIYGFGENVHHTFKHDLSYQTWPMWSRDQPVPWGDHLNHYGVHPFYMCLETEGTHAHGVLLLNSNAQDYSFTPLPMLTYRTIGGIFDFYFFMGPEPENVVQQYTKVIGRPYMPPYWSLGFQLCRYGYNQLDNLTKAVERTVRAGIPLDVQYADIDHMDERMDFTVDNVNFKSLKNYFDELHDRGMHTIIILDPTLISNVSGYAPYEKMRDTNSNIKWPNNSYIPPGSSTSNGDLLGYVWPQGKVVFPDFFKTSTKQVWKELIVKHYNQSLKFDGLWIDMNEPANFGTNEERPFNWPENVRPYWSLNCSLEGNTLEHPPYRTMAAFAHDNNGHKVMISDKTICMRAVQGDSQQYRHYDVHSLYGWSETLPTLEGLREATGERGVVISRSTFPGSGQHAGHWLGDNNSSWDQMRKSIIGILEFNLFGIPYIGADICGFMDDTTPELCKRWMQLGAFYTFSRNHNGLGSIEQDPAVLGTDVAEASRIAMETRYRLLPYLYTLFHQAHTRGNTVIRPLHHQYHYDVNTHNIDQQFMWGPALLISPILYEGQTSLTMYLPKGPWYDFYTGEEMSLEQSYVKLPVGPDSQIPLHVCGGHILPMQAPANNTHFSRQKPFTLLVALKHSGNNIRGKKATGELFWDDGVSIDTYESDNYFLAKFHSQSNTLSMTIEHANTAVQGLFIKTVRVLGVDTPVSHVYVGDNMHTDISYNNNTKVLLINNLKLQLSSEFTLEWREFRRPTVSEMERVDCAPDIRDVTMIQANCTQRKCTYRPVADQPMVPACYYPSANHGYTVVKKNNDGTYDLRRKGSGSLFNGDVQNLKLLVDTSGKNVLHIKVYDGATSRYEVPININDNVEKGTGVYRAEVAPVGSDFHVKVIRQSTNTTIWDTSVGPLKFENQFLQISARLASNNFYGLGEHRHANLKHNMEYNTWPIFSRDMAVNSPDFSNLYGVHPFYMNLEDDKGNANAVFFLNSNAMEVVLEPQPRVTYRTIGGVLDFYIFLGPGPEEVIQQYTNVIGKPYMLPYWALGFQLCRWGYNSLDNLKAAVERTKAAGIPHDIQYADIDYMDERKDFTYDKVNFAGLPEYIKELQSGGMHFIIILDPALISNNTGYKPYEQGVEQDVFIKWPQGMGPSDSRPNNSDIMLGYVWPKGKVAFPDFLKNETKEFWINTIEEHHKTLAFDGLWIDMNEPANFDTNGLKPWNWPDKDKPYWSLKCLLDNNTYDNPPYVPKFVDTTVLSTKTLCMQGLQGDGKYRHYDVHSLYGWSETEPTMLGLRKATGKRGIVISRSTYPSSGRYGGHWLGDNDSFWRNLHDSVIGIIEFNLFGIPYIGADICGFFSEPSSEMCQRWMELGAFYTFSRNHNGLNMKEQDPAIFGRHVGDSSRLAMGMRMSLLPYLYTLFYHAHLEGGTVIRSLMHEFPTDKRTWALDTQFMWGHAFMIAPVLEEGHMHKDVYFPDARWYDYYTGLEVKGRQQMITVDAPRNYIPLYTRGGYIIPNQGIMNNTVHSRVTPISLLVMTGDNNTAIGDLFWDDGDSIETIEKGNYAFIKYKLQGNTLTGSIEKYNNVADSLKYGSIWVYGVETEVKTVRVNSAHSPTAIDYYYDTKLLWIHDIAVPFNSNFTVTWTA